MAKNVRSDDPRKPAIVAALKSFTGGTKVTIVKDLGGGVYVGNVLGPIRVEQYTGVSGARYSSRTQPLYGTFSVVHIEAEDRMMRGTMEFYTRYFRNEQPAMYWEWEALTHAVEKALAYLEAK